MVQVSVTCADGRPIQALANLIEQRSKWLNETAEQSCAACMIDVLVSLRALTKVANPKKKDIEIEATAFKPSYTRIDPAKPTFCLRTGKTRYVLQSNERIGFATNIFKGALVWLWNDNFKQVKWYIIAHNAKSAKNWAYMKMKKRAQRYKGLARTALSILMKKTGSRTSPSVAENTVNKATRLTYVTKTATGSYYSLTASDLLNYAKSALKGGDSSINQAVMKASNKITSVINQKCKNLLAFNELSTPFPEVAKRR